MIKKIIIHGEDFIKFNAAFIVSKIYKVFNKEKIYIIGERHNQCQDNGYHLFKYVRKNHVDKRFYYCITKESTQLKKIKGLGNIVYYKSFKHYLYYFLADKLVCAHVGSCVPDTLFVWKAEAKGLVKKKKTFIQHGIIKELIPSLNFKNTNFDRFICGAKPEYEYVKKNFGYEEKSVKYLGLCRFDKLHNCKEKKQILIMPTWRQWFGMNNVDEVDEDEFENSNYFKKYNEVLNSEELNLILKNNDMELIFYPHHEMQRYIHLFKSKSKNIKIADKDKYDVQKLLKESQILITDYSSIAFDFAYMRKPVIYFQFDEEEYFKSHYSRGYFDYCKHGFGEVIKSAKLLNIELEKNIINGMERIYRERADAFFELYDGDNCKRHYEEIIN